MFVVWRGWGILIVPAVLIGLVIGAGLSVALLDDNTGPFVMPLFGGGFATLGCWACQRLLESTDKGQTVIVKETGEEITLKRGDSLFFIPVRWWTRICLLVTVIGTGAAFVAWWRA